MFLIISSSRIYLSAKYINKSIRLLPTFLLSLAISIAKSILLISSFVALSLICSVRALAPFVGAPLPLTMPNLLVTPAAFVKLAFIFLLFLSVLTLFGLFVYIVTMRCINVYPKIRPIFQMSKYFAKKMQKKYKKNFFDFYLSYLPL